MGEYTSPFAIPVNCARPCRHEHGQGSGGGCKGLESGALDWDDPIVINADVPTFQNQYKAKLADDMIRGNSQLDMYIRSHPLAAQVSNDDWGESGSGQSGRDEAERWPELPDKAWDWGC